MRLQFDLPAGPGGADPHPLNPGPARAPRRRGGGLALLAAGLLTAALGACASSGPVDEGDAGEAAPVDERPPIDVTFTDLPVASVDGGNVVFEPGRYVREAASGAAVMEITGLVDATIDFTGVELRGQAARSPLDEAEGIGVLLRDCRDVTVRGGTFGGYKICLAVRGCEGVRIEGGRFDHWYGQRLRSTSVAEDSRDWLWPHLNDDGEWDQRYGGAISAADCSELTIAGCRGRKGQNGILLTRVERSEVYDNDFSFLSGWGLGMYRASDNVVSHNIFDYCVRGYSHGVYWRGQDSAGILMFESCCRNIVARNSATHSGDGVFLYAGHDLVERAIDTATGSDDNVFIENDLRYAVANSLEATFSRGNAVIDNDLSGSHQHGIWGGYSSDMAIVGNRIFDTIGGAITIEHGQSCMIADNEIGASEIGFEAYWDEDPAFVQGPYGTLRSTASKGHWVIANRFQNNVLDLVVRESTGLVFHGNAWAPGTREPYFSDIAAESDSTSDLGTGTVERWFDGLDGTFPSGNVTRTTLTPWTGKEPEVLRSWRSFELGEVPGRQVVRAEERDEARGGLETIVMGEWGPWDLRSGDPRPVQRKPGGLFENANWRATWFRWVPGTSDPRVDEDAWRARATAPLVTQRVPNFVSPWGTEEVRRVVGNDHFGLVAQAEVPVPEAGTYVLSVTSDDGVRVIVDGEVLIERWDLHASTVDERVVILDQGKVNVRVEYFQITGGAALLLELTRR